MPLVVRLLNVWLMGVAEAVFAPLQSLLPAVFEAMHEVALALDQVNVLELPALTIVLSAFIVTATFEVVTGFAELLCEPPLLQEVSASNPVKLMT